MLVHVELNGKEHEVEVQPGQDGQILVRIGDRTIPILAEQLPEDGLSMLVDGESLTAYRTGNTLYMSGYQYEVHADDPLKKELVRSTGFDRNEDIVTAAMPGNVKRILKAEGDSVVAGEGVVVLEAMKMENELQAPRDGTVRQIFVTEGASVEAGALLFELE